MNNKNPVKAIFNFIKNHLIITTAIVCLIICFIDGYNKNEYNIMGYFFLFLFIVACLSPIIRRINKNKTEKKQADYLAKQIATEIKSKSTAEEQNSP